MHLIDRIKLIEKLPASGSNCVGQRHELLVIADVEAQVFEQFVGYVKTDLRHAYAAVDVIDKYSPSITMVILMTDSLDLTIEFRVIRVDVLSLDSQLLELDTSLFSGYALSNQVCQD